MICVEWWCFEAIILLAGRLPQPEVAIDVVGICVNVATTTFMIPFGLSGQPVGIDTVTCGSPLHNGMLCTPDEHAFKPLQHVHAALTISAGLATSWR